MDTVMGDVILIHIGQAGVQIGNACWELFCIEHGLDPSGHMQNECAKDSSYRTFFYESTFKKFRPRALFVDLETSVIDEIRNDVYHSLFSTDQLISGCEDAANNYARGYYTMGPDILVPTLNAIRCLVEQCESFAGFLIFHSIGGGTGSGFTTLLLENLADLYDKSTILQFVVFPSPTLSTSIVEPYNAILTTHATVELSHCVFLMDNEAIYEICSRLLLVERPTYCNINRIIAQVVSAITSSLRFEGPINVDLTEFQTNLVPYPRMHFPLVGYAPFVPAGTAFDESHLTNDLITKQCLSPHYQMVKCDPKNGRYISCCLLYRGSASPNRINDSIIASLKADDKEIRFVDWVPTGIKVGINYQPPAYVPGGDLAAVCNAVCMVANTTAIKDVWLRLRTKFEYMFADRAFVHWYICEGMEETTFYDALEDIILLEEQYKNILSIKDQDELSKITQPTTLSPILRSFATTTATPTGRSSTEISCSPSSSSPDIRKTVPRTSKVVRRSWLDRIPLSTSSDTLYIRKNPK